MMPLGSWMFRPRASLTPSGLRLIDDVPGLRDRSGSGGPAWDHQGVPLAHGGHGLIEAGRGADPAGQPLVRVDGVRCDAEVFQCLSSWRQVLAVRGTTRPVDRVLGDWQPRLQSPSRDAQAIATALSIANGCAMPRGQVHLLVNEDATRSGILSLLTEVASRLQAESNLLIYFAGHGLDAGQDFHLLTHDAAKSQLERSSLSGADLEAVLSGSRAYGILIIIDSCEGGAFADHAPSIFRPLSRGAYRILLASSRPGQKSWENQDGSGPLFSMVLRQLLSGKTPVRNTSGAIYFSELQLGPNSGIQTLR